MSSAGRRALKCGAYRRQLSVTVGTIFKDSHVPLTYWLAAIHLMCASKKGISALQLQRMLGIKTYKSAWFMAHRIRYAMAKRSSIGKLTGIVGCWESIGRDPASQGYRVKKADKQPSFKLTSSPCQLVHLLLVTTTNEAFIASDYGYNL